MVIKLAGAAAVVAAGALIGLEMGRTLQRRVETLEGFISSLQYMENAVSFTLSPVGEIIEDLSNEAVGDVGGFFKKIAGAAGDLPKLWRESLASCKGLTKEDKAALRHLGEHLGDSGKDGQVANIRLCRQRLETHLQSARSDYQSGGGLLRGMGFFCGLLIAIVLL